MCQTGSRKYAADGTDIDQLHYLNAECPFWVLYYISMISRTFPWQVFRFEKTFQNTAALMSGP